MPDYSGSFSGSFQGTISGSLLGSGILSSSTQVDFTSIPNRPAQSQYITPFQSNQIRAFTEFKQGSVSTPGTFPYFSASIQDTISSIQVDTALFSSSIAGRTTTLEAQITYLTGGTSSADWVAITNKPLGLVSSSAQISLFGFISSSVQIASEISGAFTSLSASIASRFDLLGGVGGIFALTGSFYSTTNNIQITGSLSVSSGSFEGFKVDSVGRTIIGDSSNLNLQPTNGGIIYSGSLFYFGL